MFLKIIFWNDLTCLRWNCLTLIWHCLTLISIGSLIFLAPAQARPISLKRFQETIKKELLAKERELLISLPQDQDTCFTPEEPCDIKLIKWIKTAKANVDMAIYDINRDELVHTLLTLSKKIPVRIIVDRRQAQGPHSLVHLLKKGGVQVRYGRQRGIMHHKFTIVDGKMVETGSFNYTNHASQANAENQVYLAGAKPLNHFKRLFDTMWERAAN